MRVLLLEAPYLGKVELCRETVRFLQEKKVKVVGLYASVQFVNHLQTVKQQLKDINITIISPRPARVRYPSPLLGCALDENSLGLSPAKREKIDCFLYVGDGQFHPLTLLYAQKDFPSVKGVVSNDPLSRSFSQRDHDSIKNVLQKYRAALRKFLSASQVGVIISLKPGQEQRKTAFNLEKEFPQKKFYFFIDDNISFDQLENFPFVEIWVNTACPRIAFDDQEKFRKGIINLGDAFLAEELHRRN